MIKHPFVRFSVKEQTLFAKRLSFLIHANIPVLESLYLIRTQTKSRAKIKIFDSIISDVSNGKYLAASLARFGSLFGEFTINIIRVGETSGILSQNLGYLADELSKKQVLRRKIASALVYPIFISVATFSVTGALTAFIFPKLMPVFTSLHVTLPVTTRMLIATSNYLRAWGILTIFVIILLIIAVLIVRARFKGAKLLADRLILHIPLFGSIARSYSIANICRTLGLLLKSGITLAESVAIVAQTTSNLAFRVAVERVAQGVARGEPMSRTLKRRNDLFPDLVAHMVSIGEKTGNLSSSLLYLSQLYEEEVDELTKAISSSVEPILMIVMGLLVGLIAVSVITPIYDITQHLTPR